MTEPTETADIAALRAKANAGNAAAQWLLGYAYQVGRGVPQDDAQAVAWYRKAAASAENQKQNAETRDGVTKLMTPTQIEAAQNLAREWLAAFQKCGGK